MAIADDWSVAISGAIRYTGSGTTYSVLELHRFLQDLADDAQATGDDLVDITTDTPSDRATDQILTLNSPYNIDDTAARYLYDGSITQSGGDTVYSGLTVVGTVEAGTEIMIVQDGQVLPPWWGTGVNADAANNIIMQLLIKSRDGGADIDGKRILSFAREFGDTWAEFPTTLGLANSVSALSSLNDLNNETAAATVRAWSTIAMTEADASVRLIDINNDGSNEEYYEEWDKGSQSLNDTFEWSKLQACRSLVVLADATNTGTNYVVDNATIVGQAQSFTTYAVAQELREARFSVKIGAGTPTGPLTAELYASTTGVIPTGSVLATSEEVLASEILSSSTYQEVIFRFNDGYEMAASTQYCIVIRHPTGDASNYFHVQGAATGNTAGENAAEENPASTWTAAAAADLYFSVKGSPRLHSRAGELHRGVTTQITYDTEAGGPFSADEILYWGTEITYDTLASGPWVVGDYVQFQPSGGGTVKNGGKILADTGTVLTVALENITGNLLDNDEIASASGAATTALVNGTPATGGASGQDRAGGEARMLAIGDDGTTGDLYVQIFHGSAPVDNLKITGRTSAATCLVNVTVTARTISPVFLGVSTGSNIIGAYGVGFQTTDIGSSDLFFDLTNTSRQPPNNVTLTVTGLVSGEDRVLVGPRTAGALDKAQFTIDTTLSAAAETTVSISTVAIPTDTPGIGQGTTYNSRLRVQRDNGVYWRVPWSSYSSGTPGDFTIHLADSGAGGIAIDVNATSGTFTRSSGSFLADGFEEGHRITGSGFTNAGNNATFTVQTVTALVITVVDSTGMVTETSAGADERLLASGMDFAESSQGGNATTGNEAFIAYIDVLADATTESYTAVYSSDRDLLVRVRDGGGTPIKTFEGNATFGSTSSSIAAIRTSDA